MGYLSGVEIYGLDSLSQLYIFHAVGNHTLSHNFTWENFIINTYITVIIRPSSSSESVVSYDYPNEYTVQNVNFSVPFNDIQTTLYTFVAINELSFRQIPLGYILLLDHIIPCVISTLYDPQNIISGLYSSIGNIGSPTINGFVSDDINSIFQIFIHKILD